MNPALSGPPPHARGRLAAGVWRAARSGTTPARAGKTCRPGSAPRGTRDHPRTRGEDLRGHPRTGPSPGPPPHARGRRGGDGCGLVGSADHPRTRGEDVRSRTGRNAPRGPPPHARGRRSGTAPPGSPPRTTPARAGKTARCRTHGAGRPDHPRTRGEDLRHRRTAVAGRGPPPHARGRQGGTMAHRPSAGTTPARAGKTGRPCPAPLGGSDHPRTRGEDGSPLPSSSRRFGPPPHARGRPDPAVRTAPGQRTTPARAGKTPDMPGVPSAGPDHPRTRGEDTPPHPEA